MKYDIIVPHLNMPTTEALARQCVFTIQEHSRDFRLIWIDNGGTAKSSIMPELVDMRAVIVHNAENLGFVKAVNQGLAISNADYIVIMNNDTMAVPRWLDCLCDALQAKAAGMSGPRTDCRDQWQGLQPHFAAHLLLPPRAMLAFFCVMMKREVFEKVGYLDEDFGVGFGDDDNYCARVQDAGYELVLASGVVIPHRHRTTFRSLYTENQIKVMQDKAIAMYREKLGGMK